MKLKNKEVMLKNTENLNWTDQWSVWVSKLYILILTKLKYVERGAKNRHQRIFRKVCTIGISVYIGNQKIRIKSRLDYLFTYFSHYFGICLVVFAFKFFNRGYGG